MNKRFIIAGVVVLSFLTGGLTASAAPYTTKTLPISTSTTTDNGTAVKPVMKKTVNSSTTMKKKVAPVKAVVKKPAKTAQKSVKKRTTPLTTP